MSLPTSVSLQAIRLRAAQLNAQDPRDPRAQASMLYLRYIEGLYRLRQLFDILNCHQVAFEAWQMGSCCQAHYEIAEAHEQLHVDIETFHAAHSAPYIRPLSPRWWAQYGIEHPAGHYYPIVD